MIWPFFGYSHNRLVNNKLLDFTHAFTNNSWNDIDRFDLSETSVHYILCTTILFNTTNRSINCPVCSGCTAFCAPLRRHLANELSLRFGLIGCV